MPAMRHAIDLAPVQLATPHAPDLNTVRGNSQSVNGGIAIQPDDWSKIPATSGDTSKPTNRQSWLSRQPDGSWQWRNSSSTPQAPGAYETFYPNGIIAGINPGDTPGTATELFYLQQIR